MILLADSEGLDQTAQMCKLTWAFTVRICQKARFLHDAADIYLLKEGHHMALDQNGYQVNISYFSLKMFWILIKMKYLTEMSIQNKCCR